MFNERAGLCGLPQLHEWRGRVWRGADQSFCILMGGDKLPREERERLRAIMQTNDGFELSELDLKLRGAGDITGTQQSGLALELKIANLGRDSQIVEVARVAAMETLERAEGMAPADRRLIDALRERFSVKKEIDFSMIS